MTLLLVRHGSAGDPYRWPGDDIERPLDANGYAQADHLANLVESLCDSRPLVGILSSRAVRCLQTVGPLSARRDLPIAVDDALFEGGSTAASELVRQLATTSDASQRVMVLCSHSDVIPDVVRDVVANGAGLSGGRGCAYSSVWELTVTNGVVDHAHYHQP